MGKRLGGTCYIKCDGAQFEVKGGVEVPLTDYKREAVTSTGGAVRSRKPWKSRTSK